MVSAAMQYRCKAGSSPVLTTKNNNICVAIIQNTKKRTLTGLAPIAENLLWTEKLTITVAIHPQSAKLAGGLLAMEVVK